MSKELRFAPREIFEQILEWAVIPTFDLLIEVEAGQVVIVHRKIQPYGNTWALPGLRMYKPESIKDALERIARNELGLSIDAASAELLGQYVGKFKTEHHRQDLSSGYLVKATSRHISLNEEHFYSYKLITAPSEIPAKTGAMYRYYLQQYFKSRVQ